MPRILLLLLLTLGSAAQAADVTDNTGRPVTIPDTPQRVVALHEPVLAVPLMELGVPVVGVYGRDSTGGSLMAVDFLGLMLDRDPQEVARPGIGAIGNIDLEALRALQPDLILGTDYDRATAETLSAIAPVYLQNASAATAQGISVQRNLATLLGKDAEFDALETAYQDRVDALRAEFPDLFGADTERSYLLVMITDRINVVGQMSGAVQALEDLGFHRLTLEAPGDARAAASMLMVPLGAERFGQLDPDLLVVMNSFARPERDATAIARDLESVVPGWQNFMNPARDGRVVFLDSARVTSPALASAQHTLDALETWARHMSDQN